MTLYLHQSTVWGAVEEYLGHLLAGLDEPARVIVPEGPAAERFATHADVSTFPATEQAPALFRRLVREIRRAQPRIVHVVDVWPLALLAARVARAPRVIVTHHTPELPRRDNNLGRLLWHAGWLTRPEVIYTSESDRRGDGRHGVVIPLGIDLERFAVEHKPEGIVGNVARLVPQKGLDTLIAAAPAVLERHPQVRFVLVGDGPLRPELERQASGLPVEFLGAQNDVPAQLSRFDVFAFPSRFEGLCLAVIEAQAAGVPVVATPVGGIVENVVDGETGRLVPVDDPRRLAAAICAALDDADASQRMAQEARARVQDRYSVRTLVERTLALYG